MITQKRIASGEGQHDLRVADLTQFYSLQLIESRDGVWRLSEMGLLRVTNGRSAA